MHHNEIPAYDVESLEAHATRIRDITTRMATDEVDDVLGEVSARIESSESARNPVFDLDVPDTDDVWHAWSNANESRDAASLEQLADMMDTTADNLRRMNLAAQESAEEDSRIWQEECDTATADVREAAARQGLTDAELQRLRWFLYETAYGVSPTDAHRAIEIMPSLRELMRAGANDVVLHSVTHRIVVTRDTDELVAQVCELIRSNDWGTELFALLLGVEVVPPTTRTPLYSADNIWTPNEGTGW